MPLDLRRTGAPPFLWVPASRWSRLDRRGSVPTNHPLKPCSMDTDRPSSSDSRRFFSLSFRLPSPPWVAFLVSLLLVGLFVAPNAAHRALWLDELFSLTTAEEHPGRIVELLSQYRPGYFDHPPLYFLLLHAVLFVGNSPLILRTLSLLFVAGAVALWGGLLWRRGVGTGVALATVCLLDFHPIIRWQAANVRMYALLLLLTSAATVLVFRFPEWKERKTRVAAAGGISLLLAAGVYTSYFAILFGIGVGIVGVVQALGLGAKGKAGRRDGFWLMGSCLGAAVLSLPWLPVLLRLLGSEAGASPATTIHSLGEKCAFLIELCGTPFGAGWTALGLVGLFTRVENRREWVIVMSGLVVVPLLLLFVLIPPARSLDVRYLIFAIPPLASGAVVGWKRLADSLPHRFSRYRGVLAAAVILLPVPFAAHHLDSTLFRKVPDWWGVAKILETQAHPDEIILTGGYLSGEALVYHLQHPEKFNFINYVTDLDQFYLCCRDPRVVWYVNAAPLPEAYRKIVDRYFPHRAFIEGDAGMGPIQVYAKKSFTLPSGKPAQTIVPVPLDYEKKAGT